ncbi:hypothetical protein ABLE94_22240 [Gordonia sp. VNK1]|uniref:hypothetical protein n=1 Tax=Gordonia oleivorans TaxID=3156618 RepID=UPI0032B562A9
MAASCDTGTPAYIITRYLGFDCQDANPVVTLRNPFALDNWTLPILELTIVVGAVLALVHAVRRLRNDGDPTNLALWFGGLVYLFIIEPPLYFPEWFGMQDAMGFMFSHNVFTVQFMYDRLPLYIVAFYPALSQVAYEIVRALGVFDGTRGSALRGAVGVALVYQAFYEIFDQLGPQLKWWAWNVDQPYYGPDAAALGNPAAIPLMDSVPLNSVWLFASVSFGVLAYFCAKLVADPTRAGMPPRGWSLTWRTVVAGALAVVCMPLFSIPTAVFGREHANLTGQTIVLGIEIAGLWVIGGYILVTHWWRHRADHAGSTLPARTAHRFLRGFPILYLGVLAVLWIAALPDYFGARGGITADGTPTGNLFYVVCCFVVAVASLTAALLRGRAPAESPREDVAASPSGGST